MGYLALVRKDMEDQMAVRAIRSEGDPEPLQAQVWEITPEVAGDWLAQSGTNRAISNRIVVRYAKAIENGEWRATGEAIKFSKTGRLVDGQHRLSAVLMADLPITALVVTGLDDAAFDVLDSGKQRSPSDVLHIHGYTSTKLLAAAIVKVLLFQHNGNFNDTTGSYYPSKPEVLAFAQANPRIVDICRIINSARPRIAGTPPAMLAALYYLFELVDEEDAETFFQKLRTGADLSEDSPIFQLRKRLLENITATSQLNYYTLSALIIKAWNFWREGRSIKILSFRPGGSSPEPFPEIL